MGLEIKDPKYLKQFCVCGGGGVQGRFLGAEEAKTLMGRVPGLEVYQVNFLYSFYVKKFIINKTWGDKNKGL